jgi:hypothetical protein
MAEIVCFLEEQVEMIGSANISSKVRENLEKFSLSLEMIKELAKKPD